MIEAIIKVFAYIFLGYLIKKLNFLPIKFIKLFEFFSFNILLPLALVVYFWNIKFPELNSVQLFLAFFGSGILIFLSGFFIGIFFLKFKTDDCALFGLSACFGNSVALGIPLIYAILGPVNSMPYMILVFFHGFVHFTYTTIIIETYRNRGGSYISTILKTFFGLGKNIVLFGMVLGIFLNYSNIQSPTIVSDFLNPFSKFALPTVLISLGFGLAKFKIQEHFIKALILTSLKNLFHPLIAFIIANYIFSLDPLIVFTVTIAAALPSGSQSYYFSYRYNSLQNIISANIVLSTFVSFFSLSLLLLLFGY